VSSVCTPVVLASTGSLDLAIDAANVYWTDGVANVFKCAIGGCAGVPTTLAATQAGPADIAVDATNVYWINRGLGGYGAIQKCAIAGCGGVPTTLAAMQLVSSYGHNIAVVNGNVYWVTTANEGDATLLQCAVGGCGGAPTTLASLGGSYGLAHDATSLYMATAVFDATTQTDVGAVTACPIAGCGGTPTVVVTDSFSGGIFGLALNASNLYWLDGGNVKTCVIGNCASPTTLSTESDEFALAVDPGAALYFANGNILNKCAIGGCGANPMVLAPGADDLDGTFGIAVDATYVYWTGLEGVSKTPK
jgi:hypothetical protein